MLREHLTPHDLPVEQEHSVSLKGGTFFKKKVLQIYFKKLFEQTFLGKLMEGCCSECGINDRITPKTREHQKYTFQ